MAILTFEPILHERIWGGRNLETKLQRTLPDDLPIGESWEVCDRPDNQTRVKGKESSLHDLWTGPDRKKIFGTRSPESDRFPLLIKVLDAREKLSLQVHPPVEKADRFKGEPKTECWYFIDTEPDAEIYVGLRAGVDRSVFEDSLKNGNVADCFHVLPTRPGEVMFLPSGRVHAIGGGNLILEIQQNSDTTYRVHDWDRVDAVTGRARELHVEESLECIQYDDIEPTFTQPHGETILDCIYFRMERAYFFEKESRHLAVSPESFRYGFNARGRFKVGDQIFEPGSSFILTADSGEVEIECLDSEGELVSVTWPG